ncbi:putative hydrolase of the HAD superfamily [Fontibacillus phaseoli]|uniref:Putative hydrolase of the HAD superfamily n=1 Tax=Fontibacillus phaseoli TaxID=1416533 RepID=A0A369B950_9BACL|nr:HAD family hydrolase [Fontibacillus phaseoli]RCX17076.1 putative hydrolase of the HAD superfamily [Fontibacillus phaseoli]
MERINAVLFDLDNTLMDRDWTFREFAKQLVRERLRVKDQEEIDKIVAYMIESDVDGYRPKEGFFRELIDTLPWTVKPDLTELKTYYDKNYMSHARVMEHAVDALQTCRSLGLKLGIITNGFSHLQHGKIDLLDLRGYFDAVVVSGDIGIKKPDERIYRNALERLGVAAEETIIVGDHPRNDIWGASQVGIRGVWLLRKHVWFEDLEGGAPWRTINELSEVAPLLQACCLPEI